MVTFSFEDWVIVISGEVILLSICETLGQSPHVRREKNPGV